MARVDITPKIGIPLDGYPPGAYPSYEPRISKGTHDRLYAKALVLDDGNKVAIVSIDIVGVDKEFVTSVRNLVEERTDIKAENVLVTATHTHCGPIGMSKPTASRLRIELPPTIDELRDDIQRKIAAAVYTANQKLFGAHMRVAKGCLPICCNRISPQDGPFDSEVGVLNMVGDKGKHLALLVNFSCHPTVLGADTLVFSADYPGYAMRIIERTLPDSPLCLFLHGASGDVSTRFTRYAQTFKECERFGVILAGEVLKLITRAKILEKPEIRVTSKTVRLPKIVLPQKHEAQQIIEEIERTLSKLRKEGGSYPYMKYWSDALDGARILLARIEKKLPHEDIFANIQVIHLCDNVALVAIPGELFCEIGVDIKKNSNLDYTFVVTTANDSIGYIISKETYKKKTFEAFATPISPEGVKKLYDTALKLVKS